MWDQTFQSPVDRNEVLGRISSRNTKEPGDLTPFAFRSKQGLAMENDRVIYNGVSMTPDWPAKIEAAQNVSSRTIQDKVYSRVRFGDEQKDWRAEQRPCRDCGVVKGQYHVPGCDVDECPACGGQAITCDCPD
jgi:hypothetical protein